jgi:RNA polymerase sigma-70 factor (ECF subfamily)
MSSTNLSDRALIDRVLAGESASYRGLVERYTAPMQRLVLGLVGDPHLAEDVLQEVFLLAYRALSGFRGHAQFSTWLYRIAFREAARTRTRLRRIGQLFRPLEDDEALVSRRREGLNPDLEEVLGALQTLPARQRAAFLLHVVEGKPYLEIAEILRCRPGTVGSWIFRARERLREETEAGRDRTRAAALVTASAAGTRFGGGVG